MKVTLSIHLSLTLGFFKMTLKEASSTLSMTLPMSRDERESYKHLKNILEYELKAPTIDETLVDSFHRQLPAIIEDHKEALGETNQVGLRKIIYYLEKDLIGYGKIDGLISDPFIEDISCLGINKPVYIYHRKYAKRTNQHYFH